MLQHRRSTSCDFQAHRSHQGESVAPRDRPRLHSIIERHLILVEPILEVHVHGARRQLVGYRCKRQVVRGDQSDGSPIEQASQDTFGAHEGSVQTTAFEIEGDVIRALYVVRNPDKLRHLARPRHESGPA